MIILECTDADREAFASMEVDAEDLMDDGTNWEGVRVDKPWGHEVQLYRGPAACFWRLQLEPGSETSMHCHSFKRTALIVESGEVVLQTLTRQFTLRPGDIVHIEPMAFHRSSTQGGAVLIELESPANKNDLIRYEDRYGRKGLGYERASS